MNYQPHQIRIIITTMHTKIGVIHRQVCKHLKISRKKKVVIIIDQPLVIVYLVYTSICPDFKFIY